MRIRPATVQDVDRLAILCSDLGYPTTSAEMAQRFSEIELCEDHAIFVADEFDRVIGWVHAYECSLLITEPQTLIFGLVVDEQFQGKGVGRALMQQVEKWASSRGCSSILVRSNLLRTEAHQFYERIGYAEIKRSLVFQKQL